MGIKNKNKNTSIKHELLSRHRTDCALHPGTGILRTLLQPLQTLQECLQQPRLRLQVLHTGGRSHGRGTDRGGHQRPGTPHHICPEQSFDNAGGSKVTVNGYSVASSAASAKVIAKVRATDGMVYAIDTVI